MKTNLTKDEWNRFECEILELGTTFGALKREDRRDFTTPKVIAKDLNSLEIALTVVLQSLVPLQLEHQEGQDAIGIPYNWPLALVLSHNRSVLHSRRGKVEKASPGYPTEIIKDLRELRDVVRYSIEVEKPKRGNDPRRTPASARKATLAKNFVFQFRGRFGYMPPISKTGRVVDLLDKMFTAADEDSNDAAQQLRTAIQNDSVGRDLLPSSLLAKRKRVK
jgi:hypothetical protein